MRIGELAKRSGCKVETVRFYERQGLLEAPVRDANGYRRYTEAHLVMLNFIRHCRSLGMGLPDVRTLLRFQATPKLACEEVNSLIDSQIERCHQQAEALRLLERRLRALRKACRADQKASECEILLTLKRSAQGRPKGPKPLILS